ncbi:hypothetical protein LSH36_694g01079 [Paralvinella palmiformis]|uniref:Uncharacterized protein n=1 Tax=Paralvinella palmiformis TaxID=53620 RepID=A0AAD9MTI1_9ANNE|nr:hypothetical protein LSH36_694g01079 [Paralvinella palmiformis]
MIRHLIKMAALEIPGNGDSGKTVSKDCILKTLESLDDPLQKDFIKRCLNPDAKKRPTARELLFHEVLFEVHSLKLLAAHVLVKNATYLEVAENIVDEVAHIDPNRVVATIYHKDAQEHSKTMAEVPKLELEKFLDDVKNGVYPLTAFATIAANQQNRPSAKSPEILEAEKANTPEMTEVETRAAVAMDCTVKKLETSPSTYHMTILLRMNDQMNRRLSCDFTDGEHGSILARELVEYGFICKDDEEKMSHLIEDRIMKTRSSTSSPSQPQLVEQKA